MSDTISKTKIIHLFQKNMNIAFDYDKFITNLKNEIIKYNNDIVNHSLADIDKPGEFNEFPIKLESAIGSGRMTAWHKFIGIEFMKEIENNKLESIIYSENVWDHSFELKAVNNYKGKL